MKIIEKLKIENRKWRRGFTLVELLIYMALFSILITIMSEMFMSILDARLESNSTSTIQQDSRFITSRLIYDIQRARAIVIPSALGTPSNSLQLTIDSTNYTYSLNLTSANLEVTDGTNTDQLNSYGSTISNLSFTRYRGNVAGLNTIKINFTITSKNKIRGISEAKNIETSVGLRQQP